MKTRTPQNTNARTTACTLRWGHKADIALGQAAPQLCALETQGAQRAQGAQEAQGDRQPPRLQQVRRIYSVEFFPFTHKSTKKGGYKSKVLLYVISSLNKKDQR